MPFPTGVPTATATSTPTPPPRAGSAAPPTPRPTATSRPAPRTPTPRPFARGDVLASVGGGLVKLYDARGRLRAILRTGSRSSQERGLCFDPAGHLYVTNFDAGSLSRFDAFGRLLATSWGAHVPPTPSSCVADRAGHIYVGTADKSGRLLKFDAAGHLLATFRLARENAGVDWIDLAADQCTLYYTSQGSHIKRYNVCTRRQLADFARNVSAQCYGLRLLPRGGLLVACLTAVYRLNAAGHTIAAYTAAHMGERHPCAPTSRTPCDLWKSALVALSLDPDGRSFWTATLETGHVYRVDLATGRTLAAFTAPPYQLLGGLATAGEPAAALQAPAKPARR